MDKYREVLAGRYYKMGDTRFRELKETYGMLNPSAKIDLVEACLTSFLIY